MRSSVVHEGDLYTTMGEQHLMNKKHMLCVKKYAADTNINYPPRSLEVYEDRPNIRRRDHTNTIHTETLNWRIYHHDHRCCSRAAT